MSILLENKYKNYIINYKSSYILVKGGLGAKPGF